MNIEKYKHMNWGNVRSDLPANHVLKKNVTTFFIPDNISPEKFLNNYEVAILRKYRRRIPST